ncbi:uncharacterized protein LOC143621644 [Bidens hawaiensis]|uniref:uncharacterized protein LOC143621644 n=1 Tax=Bidens hawaiensis TaxID=980011 RepID=UPI004049F55E
MSTTPGPDLVSPLSEPERHLQEGLRRRAREIAEVFENKVVEEDANPEVEEMADPNNQGRMDDFATPSLDGYGSGVTESEITVSFEIKSSIIHMVENSISFHGLSNEDPHSHVAHFLRLCATFKIQGCTDNAVRLRLFLFSLRRDALEWLEALPSGSITTWNQLVEQFLLQYFPPDKTARYRAKITGFRVDDGESLHAVWERFKGLLRKFPHHGLSRGLQCRTFFDALSGAQKQAVDQVAGGDFGRCTPNEALDVLERAAKKSFVYNPPRSIPSTKGVLHVDSNTLIFTQLEALTKRFDQMQSDLAKSSSRCGVVEDVDFQKPQFQSSSSSGQSSVGSSVENILTQPLAKTETSNILAEQRNLKIDETLQRHDLELRNQKASIQTIENQVGQIAQLLSARPQGSLPSNTEINPNVEAKAITLRSGRSTIPVDASVSTPKLIADEIETETPGELDLGEPKPTRMSIQLADRSVKYPRGIVENMLVKIDKFVFHVDFVILDTDEDKNVPLILGRPFLPTARALIDVCTGRLTLRVGDEEDTCEEYSLDTQLCVGGIYDLASGPLFEELVCGVDHKPLECLERIEDVDRVAEPKAKPSIVDPSSIELKELSSHLEYAFLEDGSRLPVIISAS